MKTLHPPQPLLFVTPISALKKKSKTENKDVWKITPSNQAKIEKLIDIDPKQFSLSSIQLIAFLENSFGGSDPLKEAYSFTTNIKSLIEDLSQIYQILSDRSLKNRITRLQKKLKRAINPNDAVELASLSSINSNDSNQEDSDLF